MGHDDMTNHGRNLIMEELLCDITTKPNECFIVEDRQPPHGLHSLWLYTCMVDIGCNQTKVA